MPITKKNDALKSNKIQILRGLAILAVVLIHNTPGGMAQVLIRPFLNFSVGLFLFLSGMLSSAENWNPWKRLTKVLIPYGIWTLIYVVLATFPTPERIPGRFVSSLLLADSAGMMYYIFVYCQFTLLIPLVDKLARSRYRWWGFVIAPAEILVMRLLPMLLGLKWNPYVSAVISVSCFGWFAYYYLGYLLGNGLISLRISTGKLVWLWAASMVLQMLEGYWQWSMGEMNCGSQMKLTAVASGLLFVLLAYRFMESERECRAPVMKKLGDYSFGIYFSHVAVMTVLGMVPVYGKLTPYPLNGIAAIAVSAFCVMLGRKILGQYGKYLAL